MSRLEELIQQLCPDGVEYKALGEIAVDIFRGNGIKREQVTDNGTPCVRYGEIYTTYGIWFDKCVSHTNEKEIPNKKYFGYGDILFAITGESIEEIAKSTAYVGHERCLAGGDIVVLKHTQDPKYLSYGEGSLLNHRPYLSCKFLERMRMHAFLARLTDTKQSLLASASFLGVLS